MLEGDPSRFGPVEQYETVKEFAGGEWEGPDRSPKDVWDEVLRVEEDIPEDAVATIDYGGNYYKFEIRNTPISHTIWIEED